MKHLAIIALILAILAPNGAILAQNEAVSNDLATDEQSLLLAQNSEGIGSSFGIEEVLEPKTFFDQLFGFFGEQAVVQEASDNITGEGSFDEANEAIGEKIGVNPVDILKAFVRAIIWVLESGVAFFSNLVN